ncbi:unnamed protein product [Orchesella dallaii]|uniref:Uncharacterized protein n=1 Tax=Orchesella dallaii TaxID=48710 RepID=A0ABP1PJ26_9HEXA
MTTTISEMTPTDLPTTNIIERSASEEIAISSPDSQEEIDAITLSIEEEDGQRVVVKRSVHTIRHSLLEREQKYHIQLNTHTSPMGGLDNVTSVTLQLVKCLDVKFL